MLREYEILFIVRPDLDDERLGDAVKTVDTLIDTLGGRSKKTDVWGRRKLAFEVNRLREGQYVLTDFEIEPDRVPEMEASLKISDVVFRHLIVRKPEKLAKQGKPEAATPPEPEAATPPEPEEEKVAAGEAPEEPETEPATG